jgi:hypothetical protein
MARGKVSCPLIYCLESGTVALAWHIYCENLFQLSQKSKTPSWIFMLPYYDNGYPLQRPLLVAHPISVLVWNETPVA